MTRLAHFFALSSSQSVVPFPRSPDAVSGIRKVLEIKRTEVWTHIISAPYVMRQAAGETEWSVARLQGVIGNSFRLESTARLSKEIKFIRGAEPDLFGCPTGDGSTTGYPKGDI